MLEPIIKVNNIKVIYNQGRSNEYNALRGESMEIYPKEYIILFGPSGCGKSTLLYSLLGILPPSSGEILVKGENPYEYNVKQMVRFQRSTVGIIFQSFNLIPSLSVIDNVALPLIFANVPKRERDRRAMKLLKQFGVDQQAYKRSTDLSGGQQQRVAVARSLINDPEILFADEPVGNLDSVSADQVMGMLEEINIKQQKTVILVTHDAKLLPYAHRVYHMKDGGVEREVINPEKKQIKQTDPGTSILSEIEKLARIYPYASPEELRVKSIVNFLTQDIGFDQIEKLEKVVGMFIDGKLTNDGFVAWMTRPVEQGGSEIAKDRAEIFGEKLNIVLKEARDIRSYRDNFTAKVASPRQAERIAEVREDLLRECGFSIPPERIARLDELLKFRIRGFIQSDDFRLRLQAPFENDGMGISAETARNATWYLEKLIGQGMYL